MKAYHVLDSLPKIKSGGNFEISDFEFLCQALSALVWKKNNGYIGLVADKTALSALGNLTEIYSEVIPLENVSDIDNVAFWAAGKIYALGNLNAPCAVIDTDFIFWNKFEQNDGVTVAHREPINPDVYPDKDSFSVENYEFNPDWDWSVQPSNTAFVAFSDNDFKNYYVDCSKKFMRSCKNCDNVLTYMVFAEQRLLSMCANEKNVPLNALMDFNRLGDSGSYKYTHLWGYKQALREIPDENTAFCFKCANRIASDFPECVKILKNCNSIKKYFGDD